MFIIKLLGKTSSNSNTEYRGSGFDSVFIDYKRLSLLENAVINYSGGIKELRQRIDNELSRLTFSHKNTNNDKLLEKLLIDLKVYLQDVSSHLNV